MNCWIPTTIRDFFEFTIPGAWGAAPTLRSSVPVLRSTNFDGDGRLDYKSIVYRDVSLEQLNRRKVLKGDILVEKSGGGPMQPAGRVAYCDCDFGGTCSNFIEIARVRDHLDSKFIFYLLHQLYLNGLVLKYQQQTTGIINFKFSEYKQETVRIPKQLREQTVIAKVLTTVDRAIEQTDALIAKYGHVKIGLMHDLLTRGIDEHGQLRDFSTHKFRPSPLGLIPESWNIEPIAKLFKMELGKMLNKSAKCGKYPKPYLGNKNVQWDWIDISDLETMDFSPKEQRHFRLKKDDILICEGGEVGRAALWKNELTECYFQKAIHRLTPKDQRIIPEFMIYYMRFVTSNGLLLNLTSQTSIAHLTQEKLAELPVCFPKPDEMRQIITLLGTQTSLIETEQAQLVKFHKLKTGLMQDLLTGNVSVEPLLNFKRGGNA